MTFPVFTRDDCGMNAQSSRVFGKEGDMPIVDRLVFLIPANHTIYID